MAAAFVAVYDDRQDCGDVIRSARTRTRPLLTLGHLNSPAEAVAQIGVCPSAAARGHNVHRSTSIRSRSTHLWPDRVQRSGATSRGGCSAAV